MGEPCFHHSLEKKEPDLEPYNEEKRTIGFLGATGIGVGAIVGGGIFALAGVAFANTGPSAILVFLLNGFIAFLTALSFAEMSSAFPESGGTYTFTKKVLSVRAAFAVGWILWFASLMACVLYALGFAFYAISGLEQFWLSCIGMPPPWLSSRPLVLFLSFIVVIFYTWKHSKKIGKGSSWETSGKIAIFCLLILLGFFFLFKQSFSQSASHFTPFFSGGGLGFFKAMGFTFIALQGFDLIAAVAGEIKNPSKTIPYAMFLSLAIALAIYLPLIFLVNAVGVAPGQSIQSMSATHPETIMANSIQNFLGDGGFWLVIIVACLSMLSALDANLLAASRIALTMAQDRTLPRMIGKTEKTQGIPRCALLVSSFILILVLISTPNLSDAAAAASLIFLISFTLAHLTSFLARLRGGGGKENHFQTPFFPFVPIAGIILCGMLAIFQGFMVPSAGKIINIWLAVGFILYFTLLSGRAEVSDALAQAVSPNLARLRGKSPLVLVPLANPLHAKNLVQIAHALSPPEVGKILLLSVVSGGLEWNQGQTPKALISSQEVLRQAILESLRSGISPEAMMTIAPLPWPEIIRVAESHNCESLIIGLTKLTQKMDSHLEELMEKIDADIVFLNAPDGFDMSKTKKILVPVGGKGGHDALRARLLGSLLRSGQKEITFLRVLPQETDEKKFQEIQQRLKMLASDEVPSKPEIKIIRNDNFSETLKKEAEEYDLIVLGTQRMADGKKGFGKISLEIARVAHGATIIIDHNKSSLNFNFFS